MLEHSRGIVLHTLRYNDERVIASVFTETRGAVSFLVSVPRSRHSQMRSVLLRPLSILDLVFDYRPQLSLQRLREVSVAVPYTSLPYDPVKASLALFLAEFLHYVLRNEERNPELFRYLGYGLSWLDGAESGLANFHLVFLIRMSRFLGFWPNVEERRRRAGVVFDLREGVLTSSLPLHEDFLRPDEAAVVPLLLRMDYPTMHRFRMSRQQRSRVLDVIIRYYRLHVPEVPDMKSVDVLRDVLG